MKAMGCEPRLEHKISEWARRVLNDLLHDRFMNSDIALFHTFLLLMARVCRTIQKQFFVLLLITGRELQSKKFYTTYIYSHKISFGHAFILACVLHFSPLIMQTVFSVLFLIHVTVASHLGIIRPRGPEDQLADSFGIFPSGDAMAEFLGSQLTTSGDTTGSTEPGFELQQQQQQPQQIWLKSPEAPLLAGSANAHCDNGAEGFREQTFAPSRLRRSSAEHSKRQSNNFCPVPEPHKLQNGDDIPGQPEKKGAQVGQADKDYPGTSLPIVRNIIMRARMWGSISQKPHEEVCGPVEVPICAPLPPDLKYPPQPKAFSYYVVPIRFCKFFYRLLQHHPSFPFLILQFSGGRT